jgi:hypothetical protein
MPFPTTHVSRGGWALTALAAVSVWFTGPHAGAAARSTTGTDFPHALLGLASLTQLATAVWVLLVVGLAQLSVSAGLLRALTPRMLRSALFAGTAGALALSPAHADSGTAPPGSHAPARAANHSVSGLPFPDRPQPDRPAAATPEPHDQIVVVHPGDTLWAIARRHLPDGAPNAGIARSCAEWFVTNRAVIGDNPDLIVPAQRLQPPTKEQS